MKTIKGPFNVKKKLTQTERLQRKNAEANCMYRQLRSVIGSPHRIHEAIKNKGIPIPNKKPGS